MFLGLAENREKGIGIGFQEMESFPKANAQVGPPQELWEREMHRWGPLHLRDYSCRSGCKRKS